MDRRGTFVGTVNYQSPEVINGEDQSCAVDIWALGCILFKMFVGTVPFKGTNPVKVYADVKARNIQWPEESVLKTKMSKEACHLIDCMLQIDPLARLGSNLDSIKKMKTHPFFDGVDFKEISKYEYKGLFPMVTKQIPPKISFDDDLTRASGLTIHGLGENNPLVYEN